MSRMLTVATARSWSRAQRKMPMPMAGSKMCSLLAISGRPSRATSPPPFSAGTGPRLPSAAVSDEPDAELPELPPASSGRPGRRSGLVSVGLSTGILSLKRNHEPVEVTVQEIREAKTTPASAPLRQRKPWARLISSSGLCVSRESLPRPADCGDIQVCRFRIVRRLIALPAPACLRPAGSLV